MSINLPELAITSFDPMVKAEYQAVGFQLRNTIVTRMDVVGDRQRFQVSQPGLAQQKAIQDDVVPMNIDYTKVFAILEDWHASEYTDIFAQREVNFDEMQELARIVAMSIGRRSDQIVIDSMNSSVPPAGNVIADAGAGFTLDKFLEVNEIFAENAVQGGRKYIGISPKAQTALLNNTQLTSMDFVRQQAFMRPNGLDGLEFLGLTFKVIPDMEEGGLSKTGDIRTCLAWDSSAVGLAVGMDFSTEINYIPEKTSHLVTGKYKAGAVAIDTKGIIKIDIDESV
jgi:hypothetical protein